jgi:hypothetical protein
MDLSPTESVAFLSVMVLSYLSAFGSARRRVLSQNWRQNIGRWLFLSMEEAIKPII